MASKIMYETRVGLMVDFVAKSCAITGLKLLPTIHYGEKYYLGFSIQLWV